MSCWYEFAGNLWVCSLISFRTTERWTVVVIFSWSWCLSNSVCPLRYASYFYIINKIPKVFSRRESEGDRERRKGFVKLLWHPQVQQKVKVCNAILSWMLQENDNRWPLSVRKERWMEVTFITIYIIQNEKKNISFFEFEFFYSEKLYNFIGNGWRKIIDWYSKFFNLFKRSSVKKTNLN